MLESISQICDLEKAFEQFTSDPQHHYIVHVRQKRAAKLRELLSGSASPDAATFDREVWPLESQTYWHELHITLQLFDKDNGQSHLKQLAWERAEELREAHRRVRKVASLSVMRLRVEPQLPPDVLGIYVYLANQVRA